MTSITRGHRLLATIPAFFWVALGASGCKVNVGNNVEPGRMAATGPENWEIDGKTYSIGSTYYVVLPPGEQLQYTIEYLISDPRLLDGMDDERAAKMTLSLMKHAWRQRLFERSTISSATGGVLKPSLIGVAITYREGVNSRGFRVQRSLDYLGDVFRGAENVER